MNQYDQNYYEPEPEQSGKLQKPDDDHDENLFEDSDQDWRIKSKTN